MENIYLDSAATTPVDKRVTDAMLPWLGKESGENTAGGHGNASSVHKFGRAAKVLLEDARDTIAGFIGAKPSELYFTSGGTESNNFAVKGIAFNFFGSKKHIISSPAEHSSVIDTLDYLGSRFGYEVTYLKTDKHGAIDINGLNDSIRSDTFLVTVMHSNNELGIINDIKSISGFTGEKNIFLHSDTVQSLGKTFLNVKELNCSTASISAHKIYGPKGIGALYIKTGTPIDKLIHGGKQERNRRGGTENIASIAGFKKAVEILKDEVTADIAHYSMLREKLLHMLSINFGNKVTVNAPLEKGASLPNIVSISFDTEKIKTDPDTLLIKLDLGGIAVSSGSACSSGSVQPSHVLKALGFSDITAKSTIRVSFGRFSKAADLEQFIKSLQTVLMV